MGRKLVVLAAVISLLVVVTFSQSFAAKPNRNEAPVVTAFDVEPASESPVPILTFTAEDSDGSVTGYLVTESSSEPSANDPNWSPTAPTTYTTASVGLVTLYAWAKDDDDAVSNSLSDTVDIPDPQDQIIADLQARVAALEDLLQHFSRVGSDVVIEGANLNVVSGSGATDGPINGTGNLVVGYNELRNDGTDNRLGSHNIIVGKLHNYASYGGAVFGIQNEISGTWSSVTGGVDNMASGISSAVCGGAGNTSSGTWSTVSGGTNNTASSHGTSVSGGSLNEAAASNASVSGGHQNNATASNSSVTGGAFHNASGINSSVSGGTSSIASGVGSSVTGGYNSLAQGDYSSVASGYSNQAEGSYSHVSGGSDNTARGMAASVSGGYYRSTLDDYDWAAGSLLEDQ